MVLKHWAMKPNDWMLYLTKMKVSLLPYVPAPPFIRVWSFTRAFFLDLCNLTDHLQIIVIVIIIGSMVLGGPCPTQAIVVSDLNPGHPPTNFYNPVSLHLPLPWHSILISVSHVLFDLQGLCIISLQVIRFHPLTQCGPPTSDYWILLH